MLISIISTFLFLLAERGESFSPGWSQGWIQKSHIHRKILLRSSAANANEDAEDGSDEWRAFRARLVQNGLPSIDNAANVSDDTSKSYAYVTTPLVEVGSILISIPTTDLCQALDQQYWHRSVVLITEVSEDVVKGDIEDIVPDTQLAQGNNRGRWSYRGLLLNRYTDQIMFGSHNETKTREEFENDTWRIQRGGDLLGLDSSETQFSCLHRKSDAQLSAKLGSNLHYTTLSIAQNLCQELPTKYNTSDFITFGGFCAWRPGQLEREMGEGREEWIVLSVDSERIWEELKLQQDECQAIINNDLGHSQKKAHDILVAGTNMWKNFLQMIDISESKATTRLPSGQLDFYDQMLQVWAEEQLTSNNNDKEIEMDDKKTSNDSSDQIGPGSIVRARSPPTNDMLLYDPEYIRSLVLILEDTPDETVGVILNRPMAAAVDWMDDQEPLPLRYGGAIDVPSFRDGTYLDDDDDDDDDEEEVYEIDSAEGNIEMYEGLLDYEDDFVEIDDEEDEDEEEEDSFFIWIHQNAKLGLLGGGTKLGTADLWVVKENDALEYLQSGSLKPEDIMVFSGVTIWQKGKDLGVYGGGLREQLDAIESFEIVRPYDGRIDNDNNSFDMERLWKILIEEQTVLTKESLDINLSACIDAWEMCSNGQGDDEPEKGNTDNDSRVMLADATVKAWLARNLLDDPLNIEVSIKAKNQ